MPLRRYPRSSSSKAQSPSPSKRSSRLSAQASSPVASLSQLPSSSKHANRNGINPSPTGKAPSALGNLLVSPRSSKRSISSKRFIEILDSSSEDEQLQPSTRVQSQSAVQVQLGLEDVVTPPLPPADDSAPTLPESIESLSGTPPLPQGDELAEDLSIIESSENQPRSVQPEEPPSPLATPPHPLAHQRPIFDPEQLQMQPLYDELKALLETTQDSDSEDGEESYEQRRQRKLRANEALLAQLGLAASSNRPSDLPVPDAEEQEDDDADAESMQTQDTPARGRGRPRKRVRVEAGQSSDPLEPSSSKKKRNDRKVKFAEDGTTKSAPLPGETFALAYIDLPALRERARNEYVFIRNVPEITPEDLATWSEDEDEDDPFEDAVATQRDSLGRLKTRRVNRQPDVLPDGTELSSCHQCRRKTADEKMKCHRTRQGVQCSLQYCRRCITVRYGIAFDGNDETLHCPRCQGYCNCSVCLRRSGFGNLISKGRERLLAFSKELRKLAKQDGLDSLGRRLGALLAENAVLEMDSQAPTPRKGGVKAAKKESKPTADGVKRRGRPAKPKEEEEEGANSIPKRRGRAPKKRNEDEDVAEGAVKVEHQLSDEVPEGAVFSPLEEDALGKLAVARRVLKHMAESRAVATNAHRDAATKPRLVVKLKIPAVKTTTPAPSRQADRDELKKTPNYHGREKDVWIRSAADYSASSSDVDELDCLDRSDDVGSADDPNEAEFEQDRTQVLASSASAFYKQENISLNVSRQSSPLTSLEGSRSCSLASSGSEQDHASFQQTDLVMETTPVSSHTSLSMPQDMQQLALVVLNDGPTVKEMSPGYMNRLLQESPAFPTLSGSDAGQLTTSHDADPRPVTPVLFGEDVYGSN